MPKCAFCGKQFVKGTGLLFVKKDGTAFFYCSSKCKKNSLTLKRSPHAVKWTETYQNAKQTAKKTEKKAVKRTVRKKKKKKKKKR